MSLETLKKIEERIIELSFDVATDLDEDDEMLEVWIAWFDDGWESNEEAMRNEIFDVLRKIDEEFEVCIEEVDTNNDAEMHQITLQ